MLFIGRRPRFPRGMPRIVAVGHLISTSDIDGADFKYTIVVRDRWSFDKVMNATIDEVMSNGTPFDEIEYPFNELRRTFTFTSTDIEGGNYLNEAKRQKIIGAIEAIARITFVVVPIEDDGKLSVVAYAETVFCPEVDV